MGDINIDLERQKVVSSTGGALIMTLRALLYRSVDIIARAGRRRLRGLQGRPTALRERRYAGSAL